MEVQIKLRNPFLLGLVGLVLLGGGAWFAWNNPERFKAILRSSYDKEAIVDVEKLRAALDSDLLLFLRHELIKEAIATGTMRESPMAMDTPITITAVRARPIDYFSNAQEFALSRTDRRVRLHLDYTHPHGTGAATGEASLSRANHWFLTSVELVR